jgi:hypothetical protein
MIKSDTSLPQYAMSGGQLGAGDRMSIGHAAFAMFGLSVLGWAVVLGPLLMFFY